MVLKISKKVISIFLVLSLIMTSCFADGNAIKFAERIIADGFYELLDYVSGSPDNSGFINVIPGDNDQVETAVNDRYSPYQKFYIHFDENSKGYKIRSLYTGKYLGVRRVDDVDSQRITQNALSDAFYQDWMIQEEYGEYVLSLKTDPGQFKYLTVVKRRFIYPTSKENVARTFKLYKADFSGGMCEITSPALFEDATYSVLDASKVNKDGMGLKPSERSGYANQKFFIEHHADTDDYTILSMYPKMFLGVYRNAEGRSCVACHSVNDTEKCRWLISKDDGFFRVRSRLTGESLEVSATGLTLKSASDENSQKFEFSNIRGNPSKSGVIVSAQDKANVLTIEDRNDKSGVILSEYQEKPNDQQSFIFDYNSVDGSNEFCDLNDGHLAVDAHEVEKDSQVFRYPKNTKMDSKWLLLKFRVEKAIEQEAEREGKKIVEKVVKKVDFFNIVLMSSVSTDDKESNFLSLTASEVKAKDGNQITLTDKDIDGTLNSQAFVFKTSQGIKDYICERERLRKAGEDLGIYAHECVLEPSGTKLSEADLKELGITEGRTTVETIKAYPEHEEEYARYEEHINNVISDVEKPEEEIDEGILKSDDKQLSTISKKLACICNKIYLKKKMKLYPVQILAVLKLVNSVLNPQDGEKGSIGELKTGEGKSFVVTLAAILLRSYGRKVDIAIPNMALASRDWREQREYYDLFGFSSGLLYNKIGDAGFVDEQKEEPGAEKDTTSDYNLEIFNDENIVVYSTGANFEWVYLEGMSKNQQRKRKYDVCIVDEADNILVDGASSPAMFAEALLINKEKDILRFVYDEVTKAEKSKQCISAEDLQEKLKSKFASAKNSKVKFEDLDRIKLLIKAVQTANNYTNGKEYVKKGEEIYCIDQNTGFIMHTTRIRDYIHEMLEIKEGVRGQNSTLNRCAVSPAIFYNVYQNLIGVTGTAGGKKEEEIYSKLYRLETFRIPENREVKRHVSLNVIEQGEDTEDLVAKEAREVASTGGPVLVILDSVRDTDEMKRKYFPESNLIQGVYARADRKSIAEAGKPGMITISTIAAGRGTNIVLTKDALKAGGLHVIVSRLPAQSRTLVQNVGRAARQGQPGSASVYVTGKEKFCEVARFDLNTVNLFRLQERFYKYLANKWKCLLILKLYVSDADHYYGATVDDILLENVKTIAEKFYWPGKVLNCFEEPMELYNIVLDMILKAWSRMYTDLTMDPKSEDPSHCDKKYDELMTSIDKWFTKNEDGTYKKPEEYIREFAERVGRDQEIFDLLYRWPQNMNIEQFILELLRYKRVQIHMMQHGIDITKPYITDEEIKFLPEEHRRAYNDYKDAKANGTATTQTGRKYFEIDGVSIVSIKEQVRARWTNPNLNKLLFDPSSKISLYKKYQSIGAVREEMQGLESINTAIRELVSSEFEEAPSVEDVIESVSVSVPEELGVCREKSWTFESIGFDKSSPQKENQWIEIFANVDEGTDSVQYRFTYARLNREGVADWSKQGETWGVISGYNFKDKVNWYPVAGKYKIYVDVKDIAGRVRTKSAKYEINPIFTFKEIVVNEAKQKIGSKFHISANMSGEIGGLQYNYVYVKVKDDGSEDWSAQGKTWGVISDYSEKSSTEWIPKEAGVYNVYVGVKSKRNVVEKKKIRLEVAEVPAKIPEIEGLCLIKPNMQDRKYVQVELGRYDKGAKIQIDEASYRENQIFYLAYDLEDGYYTIIQVGSGKCLGVSDHGTKICQYGANLRDNFKWRIVSVGNGIYELELKSNGMKLTVNGTSLEVQRSNGRPEQKFRIDRDVIFDDKEQQDGVNEEIRKKLIILHEFAKMDVIPIAPELTKISREFVYCFQNAKAITIPTTVEVEKNTFKDSPKIECIKADPKWLKECFISENIRILIIPDGVKTILFNDVKDCVNLEQVIIPQSVEKIQKGAFANCKNIVQVTGDPKWLKEGCFYREHIVVSCIPEGVEEIVDDAYSGCVNLMYVQIPESVKSIGTRAFWECNRLEMIKLPEGVKRISAGAFNGCGARLQMGANKDELKKQMQQEWIVEASKDKRVLTKKECEQYPNIEVLEIPLSIQSIEDGALETFKNLKIVKCDPKWLKRLNKANLSGLKILCNIGKQLTKDMFEGCTNVEVLEIPDGVEIEDGTFAGMRKVSVIKCDTKWLYMFDRTKLKCLIVSDGTREITLEHTKDCDNLEKIIIPRSVKVVEKGAFMHCKKLAVIDCDQDFLPNFNIAASIQEGTREINRESFDKAFVGWTSLHMLIIPESVECIAEDTFKDCTCLEYVSVPGNLLDKIPQKSVTSLKITGQVERITRKMLEGFTNLKELKLTESIQKIDIDAFEGRNIPKIHYHAHLRDDIDKIMESYKAMGSKSVATMCRLDYDKILHSEDSFMSVNRVHGPVDTLSQPVAPEAKIVSVLPQPEVSKAGPASALPQPEVPKMKPAKIIPTPEPKRGTEPQMLQHPDRELIWDESLLKDKTIDELVAEDPSNAKYAADVRQIMRMTGDDVYYNTVGIRERLSSALLVEKQSERFQPYLQGKNVFEYDAFGNLKITKKVKTLAARGIQGLTDQEVELSLKSDPNLREMSLGLGEEIGMICNVIYHDDNIAKTHGFHIKPRPVQALAIMRMADAILNESGIKGTIGQVMTGEGKSFIIAVLSILLVRRGRLVDVVTSNMELAKRDSEEQSMYYNLFGINCGYLYDKTEVTGEGALLQSADFERDKFNIEVFQNQIVYSTNTNFEFVHLYGLFRRDPLRIRPYDVVIVDEVDNMFIDQETHPAIISRQFQIDSFESILKYVFCNSSLGEKALLGAMSDFGSFGGSKFNIENLKMLTDAAEQAKKLVEDRDYVIMDGQVIIIDKSTGYIKPGSRWGNYIHEMVEIKSDIEAREPQISTCEITQRIFFNKYKSIAGVTGTIGEKEDEDYLRQSYGVSTFRLPRNFESRQKVYEYVRPDNPDMIFYMMLAEIRTETLKGRPVLVIINNNLIVQEYQARLIGEGIETHVIAGIHVEEDREVVKIAGRAGCVTVATLAAGRGTDIKLSKEVKRRGGLHVIIPFPMPSVRATYQAMGRSARQGQLGSVSVYIGEDYVPKNVPYEIGHDYLEELERRFADHLKKLYPWLFEGPRTHNLGGVLYKFGSTTKDVLDIAAAMTTKHLLLSEDEKQFKDLMYEAVMTGWGMFFTEMGYHISECRDRVYCNDRYDEFKKELDKWLKPGGCTVEEAIRYVKRKKGDYEKIVNRTMFIVAGVAGMFTGPFGAAIMAGTKAGISEWVKQDRHREENGYDIGKILKATVGGGVNSAIMSSKLPSVAKALGTLVENVGEDFTYNLLSDEKHDAAQALKKVKEEIPQDVGKAFITYGSDKKGKIKSGAKQIPVDVMLTYAKNCIEDDTSSKDEK